MLLLLAAALAAAPSDTLIARGAPLGASPAVPVAQVLDTPERFAAKPIILEGTVVRNCTAKGCWMQVAAAEGEAGVRITFKDYGFFIPTNSVGMQVRAEGTVSLRRLSKAQADHLAEEGASLKRDADGGALEVGFVATGVELRK